MAYGNGFELSPLNLGEPSTIRTSEIAIIRCADENAWITDPIAELLHDINRRHYCWDVIDPVDMQYARYSTGQHIDWHRDSYNDTCDNEYERSLVRKLTVVISLSTPDDYGGGRLMIENPETDPGSAADHLSMPDEAREQGAAVVFPGHLYHRVTPITHGVRYTWVSWLLGPPFV